MTALLVAAGMHVAAATRTTTLRRFYVMVTRALGRHATVLDGGAIRRRQMFC